MSMIDHYETLRLDVINGASDQGMGWVLLVRSGMRSWCEACHPQIQQPQRYKKQSSPVTRGAALVEHTLIQVLAGMVLNLQQGVSYHV